MTSYFAVPHVGQRVIWVRQQPYPPIRGAEVLQVYGREVRIQYLDHRHFVKTAYVSPRRLLPELEEYRFLHDDELRKLINPSYVDRAARRTNEDPDAAYDRWLRE